MKRSTQTLRNALQAARTSSEAARKLAEAYAALSFTPHWRDGGYTAWLARADVVILKTLNAPDDTHPELVSDSGRLARLCREHRAVKPVLVVEGKSYFHERINARWRMKQHIDKCARNGMIGIVESGRDCDCVEYTRARSPIPATVFAYTRLERQIGEWADGPFSLSITTPEEAQATPDESRDLALEAFEDGHPHHIVSRFP